MPFPVTNPRAVTTIFPWIATSGALIRYGARAIAAELQILHIECNELTSPSQPVIRDAEENALARRWHALARAFEKALDRLPALRGQLEQAIR